MSTTVWAYIDISKRIGDPEHIKVFTTTDAAEHGSRKTIPKAWPLSTRSSNKRDRQLNRPYL